MNDLKSATVNPDDMLDLATFHRQSDADALKSELQAQGISSQLKNEKNLQRFWFMTPAKASVHVQVERKNFEQAEKLLRHEHVDGTQQALHCPSCGSTRVQFPALTRKNILPAFIGWLLATLHITQHKYYCEACQYTWPQTQPDSKPRDILKW